MKYLIYLLLAAQCYAGSLEIKWDKVINAESYILTYGTQELSTNIKVEDNSFTLNNVRPGAKYFVYIKSIDSSGNRSPNSKVIWIKVPSKDSPKPLTSPRVSVRFKE